MQWMVEQSVAFIQSGDGLHEPKVADESRDWS